MSWSLDLDLHLVRLGQHGHRGGRGVDAALLLGLGHALDAMAAALVAQVLKDVVAGDAEDDFLVAALLAGAEGDVLDLPALVAGVVRVHVVEVAGEQGRLVAAGAGADFHDDAVEVSPSASRKSSSRDCSAVRRPRSSASSCSAYCFISGSVSADASASAWARSSATFLYSR